VVEEPGVLMSEAVVILLPDVGREEIVQRRDLPAPRQLRRHLQPLGVLAEHRVDDANEGLVAVEHAVPTREQVPLEPAFALVLAEHRVEDAPVRRQEFVVPGVTCVPLPVGDLKHRAQEVG
jgi:hypothetical protein